MNERIVFTNPDGSCAIIVPAPNTKLSIDDIMTKDVPKDAINPRIISTLDLPNDRLFREAWIDNAPPGPIGIDLAKAKVVAHSKRREMRQIELAPLDEEQNDARLTKTRRQQIAAEKTDILNRYDTIQNDIDAATSEQTLRDILAKL